MFDALVLIQHREERRIAAGERIALGGADSALALPAGSELCGHVELSGGQVFLGAPPDSALRVNGAPLRGSRVLQAGDVLELPGATIECSSADTTLRLRVSHAPHAGEAATRATPNAADASASRATDASSAAHLPEAHASDSSAAHTSDARAARVPAAHGAASHTPDAPATHDAAARATNTPVAHGAASRAMDEPAAQTSVARAAGASAPHSSASHTPHVPEPPPRARFARLLSRARGFFRASETSAPARDAWARRAPWLVVLSIVLPIAALLLFLRFGVSVEIAITPAPETLRASSAWPRLQFGARVFLLPGAHRLRATRTGYQSLELEYEVKDAPGQRVTAVFQPLPGILEISSEPAARAVEINGERHAQPTPLRAELAGGRHRVRVLGGERYQDYETLVEVEDRGRVQQLRAQLTPNWGVLRVRSEPVGAQIFVDDAPRGETPATLQVLAGPHKLRLSLTGYRDAHEALRVEANREVELPLVTLRAAPGTVRVRSEPAGARVSANGVDRGATPLDVELDPGAHRLVFFTPGYARLARTVNVQSGAAQTLRVRLEAQYGEVLLRVTPAAAEIRVANGEPTRADARGEKTLRLLARPQRIAVSHAGYGTETITVTPRANERSVAEVRLQTLAALREARRPREIKTHDGQALLLLRPGAKFQLGSSRREPARRANEVLHEVELTRPFYLGAQEVSNAAFRRYEKAHNAGTHRAYSLNEDEQPAANISWQAAALYCNWLSAQQGLPLAYPPDTEGRPVPAPTRNTGYRLPTEAEWVWAARYHGGARAQPPRYDWGDALPPASGAGNFADLGAARVLVNVLRSYRDGFIVSAPVARAAANPLGLRGLAGNVAEWMHDAYATPAPGVVLRDPRGAPSPAPDAPRVIRGASWRHFRATELRSSFRDYGNSVRDDLGFRIARDAD